MLHKQQYAIRHGAGILLLSSTIYIPFIGEGAGEIPPSENPRTAIVQVIDTAQWRPPSPDPAAISYWSSRNQLVLADSEVDEMPALFSGDNLFIAALNGSLAETGSTMQFSHEPTGVESVSRQGAEYFYITDDNNQRVYEINLGPDARYGTDDDTIASFSTTAFGSQDPEGIAYGEGRLYLADGLGSELYIIDPGPNRRFDGVHPEGDDAETHVDTGVLGQPDPEAVAFKPSSQTLLLTSKKEAWDILEMTTTGELVRVYELSHANLIGAGDLTLAPSSSDPMLSNIYVVDRGIDNNTDPEENDGKIYEIELVQGQNWLQNPDFELEANADGQPAGWSADGAFSRSSEQVHSGSYAGKIGPSDGREYAVYSRVGGITPGTPYFFFGWLDVTSAQGKARLKLELRWIDAGDSTISRTTFASYTSTTNGWTLATHSQVAPADASQAEVRLVISGDKSVVYIDDFDFGP